MSRDIIRLKFIESESSFDSLIFELFINKIDANRKLAKLTIDLHGINKCSLTGLGEFENKQLVPLSVLELDSEEREKEINNHYSDRVGLWVVMFAHSRCLRVIKYSNEYVYSDFMKLIRQGLLNKQ